MASSANRRNKLPLQTDLEEISQKLKIWKSHISSAAPHLRNEMPAEILFEQCITIGKIFEKMPDIQVRLLALQLSGNLPNSSTKDYEIFLTNLAQLSFQWRELYVQLNRWHAQLQTVFLKSSGFEKHCKTFENDLRRYGDRIFDAQQIARCGGCAFSGKLQKTPDEFRHLQEQLVSLLNRMHCYKLSLNAMKYGPITRLRQQQLEAAEKDLKELEDSLDLKKNRFCLVWQRLGLQEGSPNEMISKDSTKSRDPFFEKIEKRGFSEESSGEAAVLWEKNYNYDLKQSMEISDSAQKDNYISSLNSSLINSSDRSPKSDRLQALLLSTLPLDFLFLGTLVILVMFLCPTWDRFSLCSSLDSLAMTWSRRWNGVPPS